MLPSEESLGGERLELSRVTPYAPQTYVSAIPPPARGFNYIGSVPTPEELNRAGLEAYKAGDLARAIEAWEAAVAAHPGHAPGLINLSLAYVKKGRPDDAI